MCYFYKLQSIRLSEDYHFEKGNLTYHDTYFGTRDFIGEEIIYNKSGPIWGMNYFGYIINYLDSEKDIYDFLRKTLLQDDFNIIPIRGPKMFIDGEWKYENKLIGKLDRFSGEENIYFNLSLVYRGNYHGGLII